MKMGSTRRSSKTVRRKRRRPNKKKKKIKQSNYNAQNMAVIHRTVQLALIQAKQRTVVNDR